MVAIIKIKIIYAKMNAFPPCIGGCIIGSLWLGFGLAIEKGSNTPIMQAISI